MVVLANIFRNDGLKKRYNVALASSDCYAFTKPLIFFSTQSDYSLYPPL